MTSTVTASLLAQAFEQGLIKQGDKVHLNSSAKRLTHEGVVEILKIAGRLALGGNKVKLWTREGAVILDAEESSKGQGTLEIADSLLPYLPAKLLPSLSPQKKKRKPKGFGTTKPGKSSASAIDT
jgi:hypothetical protein